MKQLLQALDDGSLGMLDVPSKNARRRSVAGMNLATIVSPGTGELIMDLESKCLMGKTEVTARGLAG